MKFQTYPLHINPKQNNGILVDNISHDNPYDISEIHRHTYHEILFFSKANGGEQKVDFKNYRIKEKAVYIITAGQIHLLKKKPEEDGVSIQFSEEFLSLNFPPIHFEWMNAFRCNTEVILKPSKYNELLFLTQKLLQVFESGDKLSYQKVVNYLSLIMINIFESIDQESIANYKNNGYSLQFISLVQTHFRSKRNVREYANLMGISTDKLMKEVGKFHGKSPKEIIQDQLLLEVKRLLAVGELSHKEISHQLNFDSQNSYNRFVSTHTQFTPSELKRALAEIHNE